MYVRVRLCVYSTIRNHYGIWESEYRLLHCDIIIKLEDTCSSQSFNDFTLFLEVSQVLVKHVNVSTKKLFLKNMKYEDTFLNKTLHNFENRL